MGYEMHMVDSEFHIAEEDVMKAHGSILCLMARQPSANTFAWMHNVEPMKWQTLERAMKAWRFPIERESGDVVGISFKGEKIGDESKLFNKIAPFVSDDSYIKMEGEDGQQWTWAFNGNMVTKTKRVSEGDTYSFEELNNIATYEELDGSSWIFSSGTTVITAKVSEFEIADVTDKENL